MVIDTLKKYSFCFNLLLFINYTFGFQLMKKKTLQNKFLTQIKPQSIQIII